MKYAMMGILLLALAACGNEAPPPPPEPAAPINPGGGTGASDTPTPQPTIQQPQRSGPSLAGEYERAYRAARDAVNALNDELNHETYAIAGARCYDAKRIEQQHVKNGYPLSSLRQQRDFNRYTWKSWKDFYGKMDTEDRQKYEEHPEYVAALKAYQDLAAD